MSDQIPAAAVEVAFGVLMSADYARPAPQRMALMKVLTRRMLAAAAPLIRQATADEIDAEAGESLRRPGTYYGGLIRAVEIVRLGHSDTTGGGDA